MNSRLQPLVDRLSALGYVHVAESDRLFLGALKQALGFMPQDKVDMVLDFMAKGAGLTPAGVASDPIILEIRLRELLHSATDIVLDEMKNTLAGYSLSKRRDASLKDLMEEMREFEVRRFMRSIPAREHALLLYSGSGAKDRLLQEFFDAAGKDLPRGIVTKSGLRYDGVDTMTYDVYRQKNWNEIVDTNLDWFVRNQAQKSNFAGRFAAEDHSWYIHHGFTSQLLEMEQSVWKKTQADWVFLCCYDLQLVPEEYLDRIIEPHSYVVLDDPCMLYRSP